MPLHFHPQTPLQPVIDAYYSDLPGPMGPLLAGAGLGWYDDLGVQYLRMIFSGVFDRFPGLQVIAGHWGEVVLFYLDHTGFFAESGGLRQPLADYFKHFRVAGSGTNSPRYLRWTAEVMGTDRMLYSADCPFTYGFRPGGFPTSTPATVPPVPSWRTRPSPTSRRPTSATAIGNARNLRREGR
ncbi:hypothetical protein [Streptomyces laurentii]|uniref:hypothetical protein n=1 Tax=Streptomyces laurentii TaxID=39478 RepID=UPI0033C6F184